MILTPQWKKSIIPKIIEKIYLSFNKEVYQQHLCNLINGINRYENDGNLYLAIKWNNDFYVGFASSNQHPFKAFSIKTTHPYFNQFMDLNTRLGDYKKLVTSATNYLSVGLSMCHSTECVQSVFPESVLNVLNKVQVGIQFIPTHPQLPKHIAFVKKNEFLIEEIEKQLVINLIAPVQPNAEIPF